MNSKTTLSRLLRGLTLTLALGAVVVTAGCGGGESSGTSSGGMLNLNLPDSLTGGATPAAAPVAMVFSKAASSGTGEPCAFEGTGDDDDVFRNGYNMTKFMVSAVATWTCFTDTIIDLAATVPHDGQIHETENDTTAVDYEADEPTHYSVTDDSETQTTARIYFGYDRVTPPSNEDSPGFFVSWNEAANGDITGRLIIDVALLNPTDHDPEDPTKMRMDFNYTTFTKTADMYLQFDSGNEWAEGLRIQVVKDLTVSPSAQVFTARGLMDMKAQFLAVAGIAELPQLKMFTISDRLGNGAAIAEFVDVALGFEVPATGDHFGNYLFDKTDRYFFEADQDWDWIEKDITRSEYRGSRALTTYTLDGIEAYLGLSDTYFDDTCNDTVTDCNDFLNAIFADGFEGQEQNQGTDPADWRSSAIAGADYLTTIYPNGTDWTGAFDPVFIP